MRLRLFGKFLLAFWLTLIVMNLGTWLFYAANRTPHGRITTRAANPLLTLLAHTLERQGPIEADKARQLLQPMFRDRITIARETALTDPEPGDRMHMIRRATAPDGRTYILAYRYQTRFEPGPFAMPEGMLLILIVAGLLFSMALAHYVTRPLVALREGFNRIAQGDLKVRIQERVGRKGDEIADLALEFDSMAARLSQLVTARDRLLHDVSHELRSPLTRLQLAIGLARQDPRRTEDSLDRIDREARKLDEMVHELLALARAESGVDDDNDYFDPVALAASVIADARFEAQCTGNRIAFTPPVLAEECRPSVRGSAKLIWRAIENVVRNAVRFSPAGGLITVRVDLVESPLCYRFTIMDEGPGADAETIDTLFEPFVRADRAGIGLGLAIAKRAVLAHRGSINASNRPEGGFMVEIEIPAVTADPTTSAGLARPRA